MPFRAIRHTLDEYETHSARSSRRKGGTDVRSANRLGAKGGYAGHLNIIWGIAAVSSSHFFVANAHYVISDLNTWGWILMAFGAAQVLAALSIWRGGGFGRWFGIIVAGLAAIAAMLSIPAYPLWSLVLIALDVMIIYALAVYGGQPDATW